MKTFQTNAGLGYNQLAYLIKIDKNDYLCIGTENLRGDDDMYIVGELVYDLDDIYIEDTNFKIEDSELFGTFLFDFFSKNYKFDSRSKTREEAAENYSDNWEEITGLDYELSVPSEVNKIDFINGAKWEEQNSDKKWTNEEVLQLLIDKEENTRDSIDYDDVEYLTPKQWFEQFKK